MKAKIEIKLYRNVLISKSNFGLNTTEKKPIKIVFNNSKLLNALKETRSKFAMYMEEMFDYVGLLFSVYVIVFPNVFRGILEITHIFGHRSVGIVR
jgi:hypothetical protein